MDARAKAQILAGGYGEEKGSRGKKSGHEEAKTDPLSQKQAAKVF